MSFSGLNSCLHVPLFIESRYIGIIHIKKRCSFLADIDEGRLHAGKNSHHFTEIDITYDWGRFICLGMSLDQKIQDLTILNKRLPVGPAQFAAELSSVANGVA